MIISRTPFRVSFVGGGSDIDSFYREKPGAVVSTTIDKYMYVTINERFDDTIRVAYTKTEIVDSVDEIRHDLVREAMRKVGIDGGLEVTTIADVPAGTGLGSSSSLTVGLLRAFYAYRGMFKDKEELAKEACEIEIDVLDKPIGKQDQYAASFGGLNYIEFYPDETVSVEPIVIDSKLREEFEDNLLLFYTGETRDADEILDQQKSDTEGSEENMAKLSQMVEFAGETMGFLEDGQFGDVGDLLHENWLLKQDLSAKISNSELETTYKLAREAGAKGGKVLGAGGGGFFLFYCDSDEQDNLRKTLAKNGFEETSFKFENEGSKIIYAE